MADDIYDDEYIDDIDEISEIRGGMREVSIEDKIIKNATKLNNIDSKAYKSQIEIDYQNKKINKRNKHLKILLMQTIDKYRKNPNKFIQHPTQIKNLPPNWLEDAFSAFSESELSTLDKKNIRTFFESLEAYRSIKAPRNEEEEEDYKRQVGYTTPEELSGEPPFSKYDEISKLSTEYDEEPIYSEEDEIEQELSQDSDYITQQMDQPMGMQPQTIPPMQLQQPQIIQQQQPIIIRERTRGYNFDLGNITPGAQKFIKQRKTVGSIQSSENISEGITKTGGVKTGNSIMKYLYKPKSSGQKSGVTAFRKSGNAKKNGKITGNAAIGVGKKYKQTCDIKIPKLDLKININNGKVKSSNAFSLPKIKGGKFTHVTSGNIGKFKTHGIGIKESNIIRNSMGNMSYSKHDETIGINLKKVLNKDNMKMKVPSCGKTKFDMKIGRMAKRRSSDEKPFIDVNEYEDY